MTFDERYFAIGRLDRLSYGRTVVHCLDPRVKVVVTLLFLVTVVSFPPHEVAALLPFFLFPVLSLTLGGIPAGFILRKILVVSPFALMIGIFNPLLDTGTVVVIAGFPVSAGWISFVSILLKFVLTTGAALLLVATTSFPGICHALRRLGCPSLFVSQLLFLYRYLFVLVEEAMRITGHGTCAPSETRSEPDCFCETGGVLFCGRWIAPAGYTARCSPGVSGGHPGAPAIPDYLQGSGLLAAASILLGVFKFCPVTEGIGRLAQGFWP